VVGKGRNIGIGIFRQEWFILGAGIGSAGGGSAGDLLGPGLGDSGIAEKTGTCKGCYASEKAA
jgi:hypothetical protein